MDNFDYSSLGSVDIEHLRNAASRARALLAAVTPAAIEIGQIIAAAKDQIPHGKFGDWCLESLGIHRRRAQLYMRLAKGADVHGREQIEKLSLTAAQRAPDPTSLARLATYLMDASVETVHRLGRDLRGLNCVHSQLDPLQRPSCSSDTENRG
jgi:hypothetical protein